MSRTRNDSLNPENDQDDRRTSVLSIFSFRERHGSILSGITDIIPENLPLPSSFVPTAPIVQEILSRDIAECSDEDHDNEEGEDNHAHEHRSDSISHSQTPPRDIGAGPSHHHSQTTSSDAKLAFHPNGVAYGLSGFSAVSIQGVDRPVPNPQELQQSLAAEVDLLRDNDLIPSHSSEQRRRSSATFSGRVYRRFLSTRVRDHDQPVDIFSTDVFRSSSQSVLPDERAPLLARRRRPSTDTEETLGESDGDSEAVSDSDDESVPTPPADEIHQKWDSAVAAQVLRTTWQRETKTLVQYSAPLIVTFLLHYSVTVASVLTVGRLGMVELAAVNLATMTASITCYVPVQGLATCLDTLCAQAYGSGHKHLVGLQAQRMTWFLWILMVPIAVLWWFSGPILEKLVPGEETAGLSSLYLKVLILGMPGVAALESGKRFVQAQGLFHATTYVLLITAPLSFFLNWLFVFRFGWGFAGSASAMAIVQNLIPILLVLYVVLFEGKECWSGFSWKAFRNWGPMIKLALPGMIMIEAQFSVLEILTIAAGQLGTAHLAAQSVLVTVTSTSFNIPFPLAIATSTRVANLIGANLGDAARTTTKVAIFAALVVGVFNMIMLIALRRVLPAVFTDDERVIDIASTTMIVCGIMQIFDALAAVSHGILRGVGRQAIGGYANLFSYYFVALPVSLSTAFALGWKLSGLWAGLVSGLAVVSALELLYLYNSDWDSAIAQAVARMRSEEVEIVEPKAAGTLGPN
ncbi:uncharacterized protein PgNI_09662 [Pyricularia grisea]|uniref:Uncharacterized protein n=1 Tax=Pyricularia grisea TaxID=148305 RepID=A0A6P8ARM8_PYRGI|nr:uncharacterized protein PgNI_09662 [Pyricularia grisea]TLD04789.1 hypothetical protein PgNI_09662 [Pyricularia grisea]